MIKLFISDSLSCRMSFFMDIICHIRKKTGYYSRYYGLHEIIDIL